jgi:hemerythrin superfamily protein
VKLLIQDHRAVSELADQFEEADEGQKKSLSERICKMLTVHAQIEEELFYPAAHEALGSDSHLIAEAQVEHASLKELISQIEGMDEVDEMFEAKMQVLTEYVKHHVQEEENEIFPRVQKTDLDLDAMGEQIAARKQELMGEEGETAESEEDEEPMTRGGGRSRSGGRGHRPSLIHSGRR